MSWQPVLEAVAGVAQSLFMGDKTQCAIIGSVASALQGCHLSPRDLDILAIEPETAHRFAALMSAYTPTHCEHSTDHPEWLSSSDMPLSIGPDDWGYLWHFGRWEVGGMKVEVAHIAAPQGFRISAHGAGIWEAGPEIWPHIRCVPFAGALVPVVPLEIQLETSLVRGMEERTAAILAALRQHGYDSALIQKALDSERLKTFEGMIQADPG
jgi:hypothetical protein